MTRSMFALGFALLSGCATFPEGPSIRALPGTGKSMEEFRAADDACRQDSLERVRSKRPDLAVSETDQTHAVAATTGDATRGGSIMQDPVTASGTASAMRPETKDISARDLQHEYDYAYVRCMYVMGHRVPVPRQAIAPWSQHPSPSSASGSTPSDAYPKTPPRDSWYAPPPDFYPVPASRSDR